MLTPEEQAKLDAMMGQEGAGTPPPPPTTQAKPAEQNGGSKEEPDGDEDIASLKAKIELMSKNLTEMDSKLDDEFYGKLDTLLSDEELDMRFADDQRPYLQAVEAKRKAYIAEQKKALEDELNKLTDEYGTKKESAEMAAVRKAFLAQHPDANLKAMQDFMENDVTPRQKAEIEKDVTDFGGYLEAVYAAFTKAVPTKETKPVKQPPNFSEENTTPAKDPTKDVEDLEFQKAIGLGD